MSNLDKLQFVKPADIETRSFEIITSELGDRVLDPEHELVIKRVIHTSADFEYADTLTFSEHATNIGVEALKNGCSIVTDTKMAAAGINKRVLAKFGGTVHNFISDPDVAAEAKAASVPFPLSAEVKATGLPAVGFVSVVTPMRAPLSSAPPTATVRPAGR